MSLGVLVALFKAVACLGAALAVIARLPRVVRQGRPDLVWVGTGLAALAFGANPLMASDRIIDAWLGGTNMFHLLRTLVALGAMWCLRAALVQSLQGQAWSLLRARRESAAAAAILVTLTAAFFAIDRGPTSGAFIPDHLDQSPTLVYALLIMVMGGWNAVDVARVAFRELAQRRRRDYLLWPALLGLGFGSCLLVVGCALEAGYAALGHLGALEPVAQVMRAAFEPVFMPGAALVCLAVAWLGLYAQGQRLQVGPRMDIVRIASVWRQVGAHRWSTDEQPPGWFSALSAPDPHRVLYSSVIAIEDTLRAEDVILLREQRRALAAVERRFELTS